jgi:hypothetical protein
MAKTKKKRNKKYTGIDAAVTTPTIVHVTASNRSKLAQWFYERRQLARPVGIAAAIAIVVILVVVGIVHLATS